MASIFEPEVWTRHQVSNDKDAPEKIKTSNKDGTRQPILMPSRYEDQGESGLCQTVCQATFVKQQFDDVKHVILGVQNYRHEGGDSRSDEEPECASIPVSHLSNEWPVGILDTDDDEPMEVDEIADVSAGSWPLDDLAERGKEISVNLRKKDKEQVENILKALNALLNSGGGVLKMKNVDRGLAKAGHFDDFFHDIQDTFLQEQHSCSWNECIDRVGDHQSKDILLFVKGHETWVTRSSECYESSGQQVRKVPVNKAVTWLKESKNKQAKKKKFIYHELQKHSEFNSSTLIYEDVVHIVQDKQIQYKHSRKHQKNICSNKHLLEEEIPQNISAFANTDGGNLMIGIEEDQKDKKTRVKGVKCTSEIKEEFEDEVKGVISKMEWGFEPEKGRHWEIDYLNLQNHPEGDDYSVIVISVAAIRRSGGVYKRCPESYHINEAGNVVPTDMKTWKKKNYNDTSQREHVTQRFENMGIRGASSQPVYSIKGMFYKIKKDLFESDQKVTIWPKSYFQGLPMDVRKQIDRILQRVEKNRGVAVFHRSLLSICNKNKLKPSVCRDVVCDLLLCTNKVIYLLTLANRMNEDVQKYNRETGKSLKIALLNIGGCNVKFCVNCDVVAIQDGECGIKRLRFPRQHPSYPPEYNLNNKKYNTVCHALTVLLSAIPSSLAVKVGHSFLNILTYEQFKILWQDFNKCRHMWVEGPPGTGKTLMAVEVIKKLQNEHQASPEEILYVNENKGMVNIISKRGLCRAVCRATFVKQQFDGVKHVILDGVQNYRHEGGDAWYKKAKEITDAQEGYFWCFIDMAQKMTHAELSSGIPENRSPCHQLTEVVRNSKKVHNFAKKYMTAGIYPQIRLVHDYKGEVKFESFSNNSPINKLMEIIDELQRSGYSFGEIAVIFRTKSGVDGNHAEIFKRAFEQKYNVKTGDAEHNYEDVLVVSSVREYSELERPVVIGVNPHVGKVQRDDPFMLILCTRAICKLILLEKMK